MKKGKKLLYSLFFVFFLFFGLVSCGGVNGAPDTGGGGSTEVEVDTNARVIYQVNYTVHSNNFLVVINNISTELKTVDGYVYSSNQSQDYAQYVYKVPTANLNTFMEYVDQVTEVSNKSISSTDITSDYNDVLAQIEVLEARKEALLKMEAKEDISLSELLSLNDRLDEVNLEIKKLEAKKAQMDSVTNYSTITINYYVSAKTESDLYWSNYFSFIITIGKTAGSIVLYSLPFAAIAGIVIVIVLVIKKKKKN